MSFDRQQKHKHKKLENTSWRNPVGKHSKVRLEKKHAAPKPKAGYRTNKEIRGKHPSGYEDILVHNTEDLEKLNPEEEAARIASGVGGKKRSEIIEKADEEDIKVLNRGEDE